MKTNTSTLKLNLIILLTSLFFLPAIAQDDCPYYFRTLDGSCNNFENPEWGNAGIQMFREIPSHYGPPDFKYSYGGQGRLNPRAISNIVCAQGPDRYNFNDLSSFTYSWGQFLDHDITATPGSDTEEEHIPLPEDEPLFRIPIEFKRSAAREGTGIDNPRQQSNDITAWIDASQVYGSDNERASWLRTYQGGKLKTSYGNRLPYNTIDGEKDSPVDPHAPKMAGDDQLEKLFVAGDERANEQPGLTALHTLFVREHNRLCDEFIRLGYTDDDGNYNIVRSIIIAYMQAITYNEYLPALGIKLDPYKGYDPTVRPDIMNIFATAAFRYGHSNIDHELLIAEDDYFVSETIPLARAFFTTRVMEQYNIKPIILGLITQKQQSTDPFIIDNLRNFLFAPTPNSPGLDLAALNIQRGRDHGLPDYNRVRTHYLGAPATSWEDITTDPEMQSRLQAAYGNNINDLDLWVGLMAEDHIHGGEVGPTMAAVIKDQFERLRDGDRFYYEIDPVAIDWWEDIKHEIKLATIIYRNIDAKFIPYDVFRVYDGYSAAPPVPQQNKVSIAENKTKSQSNVIAFPNPTPGEVGIRLKNEDSSTFELQVLNLDGKVLKQLNSTRIDAFHQDKIDLSDLPDGIYALQMKVGDQRIYKRVIKSK